MSSAPDLERVLEVIDSGSAILPFDRDDIKACAAIEEALARQELDRHAADLALLPRIDRLERGAETVAAAASHLDEHDHTGALDDEVDLTEPGAEVLREKPVAGALEVAPCDRLAAAAALAPVHGAGALAARSGFRAASSATSSSTSRSSVRASPSRPENRA